MASILKPNQSPADQGRQESGFASAAGFNLDDFAAAGVRHLKAAEAEAQRVLEDARREAEVIKANASKQGLEQGLQQAQLEADARVKEAVDQELSRHVPLLESIVQQISDLETSYLDSFRENLLGTALAAAERLTLARLDREPELLTRWAEKAIGLAKSARRLTVAIHPETLAEHGTHLEALLAAPGMPEDTRIEPDETVEPAGVVVRCDGGSVDMTLSSQLERLDEMLRGS
jgi:flagellar biosynthesis/type III secretory pathway protein FliH